MRKKGYSVIVNWNNEEECFVVQSKSRVGCVAKGKSLSAALQGMQTTRIREVRLTAGWQKS
ncbi:hypothetical protein SAMN02910429_00137 [Lachnobacterium bovis]|uniref:Uncharacterized protein n=1 Tax=Lachnobacterium bovis TaxID=140626 RepID=A0A1H9P8G8_9FIRM|nr:hypothetical protein SAMN02910429_00137 [Lachnobacterium bovis]